jgi:hypothetical protein
MMSRVRCAVFRAGSSPTSKEVVHLTVLVLHSLFSGLLSGLDMQSEISELLEELYYDALE